MVRIKNKEEWNEIKEMLDGFIYNANPQLFSNDGVLHQVFCGHVKKMNFLAMSSEKYFFDTAGEAKKWLQKKGAIPVYCQDCLPHPQHFGFV